MGIGCGNKAPSIMLISVLNMHHIALFIISSVMQIKILLLRNFSTSQIHAYEEKLHLHKVLKACYVLL